MHVWEPIRFPTRSQLDWLNMHTLTNPGTEHNFRSLKIFIFLELKTAFDLVNHAVLWLCPSWSVLDQFISLIQSLCTNSPSRTRAHGDLLEFTTGSRVRPGCLFSSFLFEIVMEMEMKIVLSSCKDSGTDICLDNKTIWIGISRRCLLSKVFSRFQILLFNKSITLFRFLQLK